MTWQSLANTPPGNLRAVSALRLSAAAVLAMVVMFTDACPLVVADGWKKTGTRVLKQKPEASNPVRSGSTSPKGSETFRGDTQSESKAIRRVAHLSATDEDEARRQVGDSTSERELPPVDGESTEFADDEQRAPAESPRSSGSDDVEMLIPGDPFSGQRTNPEASGSPRESRASARQGVSTQQGDLKLPSEPARVPDVMPSAPTPPVVETEPGGVINIPFANADTMVSRKDLELRMNNGLITLIAREASLSDILAILAQDHGLNIVSSEAITEKITVTLRDVPLADALNAILSIQGLSWSRRNNIISISRLTAGQSGSALVQGRVIRVYPLSYVSSTEVEAVVKDLLSPVGRVKSMQSEKVDTRKTTDRLIVEDLPEYLDRIDVCLRELDRPPRQVQIEAHILEVELSADNRHGVNLESLSDVAGTKLSLKSPGFAKSTSNPAMLFGIDGSKVDGLLDALKNTVDARTLASPQVLVTHGQEAKIQIGGKIGYRQSTTTETSTVQGVEFLDVGVVLTVTPYIGTDGQILMRVNPEVSDGAINLDTELPDEQITTVNSTVLLNNGQGMVIGGLIREDDDDRRAKAPVLGELWMVGKLFQSVRQKRSRSEVIVVLVPRIVDCACPIDSEQEIQIERTETPLFRGALERQYRPWESELPEVLYRPQAWKTHTSELRSSEGMRLNPEAPRSGEFYYSEPQNSVPVRVETSPPPVPAVPPEANPGNQVRHIPVEQPDSVGEKPVRRASANGAEPGVRNRQNSPEVKNQAFHGMKQKSESGRSSGSGGSRKQAAAVGSSSKGHARL